VLCLDWGRCAWAYGSLRRGQPEPPGDQVLIWNDQTNRAIEETAADPFQASRALALESIAGPRHGQIDRRRAGFFWSVSRVRET